MPPRDFLFLRNRDAISFLPSHNFVPTVNYISPEL